MFSSFFSFYFYIIHSFLRPQRKLFSTIVTTNAMSVIPFSCIFLFFIRFFSSSSFFYLASIMFISNCFSYYLLNMAFYSIFNVHNLCQIYFYDIILHIVLQQFLHYFFHCYNSFMIMS